MNTKRLLLFVVIGILMAGAVLSCIWLLGQGGFSKFKEITQGTLLVGTFFSCYCAMTGSVFSFGNDMRRRSGLQDDDAFADFFSAEEHPCLTGLATGFASGVLIPVVFSLL